MDTLGDYLIQKQWDEGIFGAVYLAEHRFTKRLFALKALPETLSKDPAFIRRFELGIAEIASLDHPHIVKIHTASCQDDAYYIVSDPLIDDAQETLSLESWLQTQKTPVKEAVIEALLRQAAGAIDYARGKGVAHGSLKLENLLVSDMGEGVCLQISDFGIARLIGEGAFLLRLCNKIGQSFSEENSVKRDARFARAFAFLAPEQKELAQEISIEKADVYAFGVLTYYLLVGKVPDGCFDLPSRLVPGLTLHWDLLLRRCLQPKAHLRPEGLVALMDETLRAPREAAAPLLGLPEIETRLESINQLAFAFPQKGEGAATASLGTAEAPKLLLKPQEIARPQYEPDPGAIFQRDMAVSHYTPKVVEQNEPEPLMTEMVLIPAGGYMRGSREGARDEMPRHEVRLPSFALDIHPVTNEQFVRFLHVMGGEKDHNNNDIIRLRDARIKRSAGKLIVESGYAKHPVVGVTWYGAVAYAKWVGKRLPLEAEWEAAASGGDFEASFPTGAQIERSQANFFSSDTTAVMSYAPNAFGLYDMAGNVYEWCQDWYAYNYYDSSLVEPERPSGPPQGVYRVLRGGCWKSLKEDLRVAHRHRNNPGALNGTYGFRCAADVVHGGGV